MRATWYSADPPPQVPLTPGGWLRVMVRAGLLALLIGGGLALLGLIRLVEYPLCAPRRPVTPRITRFVCRTALRVIGIGWQMQGRPVRTGGAMLANHGGWLDILALNAATPVYFVAKAEVAGWPGIGILARATGTLFIRRDRVDAAAQVALIRDRLRAGHLLALFPEGTSSDGLRILPFKPALFAAFLDPALPPDLPLQPVTLRWQAPSGADARFYGWWGDMGFGAHALQVLAAARQGAVTVTFHPPLQARHHADRKALALAAETAVRDGFG